MTEMAMYLAGVAALLLMAFVGYYLRALHEWERDGGLTLWLDLRKHNRMQRKISKWSKNIEAAQRKAKEGKIQWVQ